MGLYGFKARFVPYVESGEKTHTIRSRRVHPDKPGDTLHLYAAPRTKQMRLLMRVPCVRVEELEIVRDYVKAVGNMWLFVVDGNRLSHDEIEALARRDGFASFNDMLDFWKAQKRTFPWKGDIIHWDFSRRQLSAPAPTIHICGLAGVERRRSGT